MAPRAGRQGVPGDRELVRLVAAANGLCKIRRTARREEVDAAVAEYVGSPQNALKLEVAAAREVLAATWLGKAEATRTFGGLPSDMLDPEPPAEAEATETAG